MRLVRDNLGGMTFVEKKTINIIGYEINVRMHSKALFFLSLSLSF